jgi:hypothetical protein
MSNTTLLSPSFDGESEARTRQEGLLHLQWRERQGWEGHALARGIWSVWPTAWGVHICWGLPEQGQSRRQHGFGF